MKSSICVILVLSIVSASLGQAQTIRTLNLDFGNGSVYVGDDGILSSPDGTYWNKVNIDGNGIVPRYSFLDEFGQAIVSNGDFLFTEVAGEGLFPFGSSTAQANTSTGAGPLGDGVTLRNDDDFEFKLGVQIRELSPLLPVSVVIYFNDADPIGSPTSSIGFTTSYSGQPTGVGGTATSTGQFPGLPGTDHLQFNNAPLTFTTLGWPPTYGIALSLPPNSTAHIGAIQIRGYFAGVPEPSSLALIGISLIMTLGARGRPQFISVSLLKSNCW